MSVQRLNPPIEPAPNNPCQELMFEMLEPFPPAKQKRFIMQARNPNAGMISDQDAEILMSALNLGSF